MNKRALLLAVGMVLTGCVSHQQLCATKPVLTWKPGDATSRQHIERRVDNEPYKEIAVASSNVAEYRDDTVQSNKFYCYRLRAERDGQFSPYSQEVCLAPICPEPPRLREQ